jgi:hypothetical protein
LECYHLDDFETCESCIEGKMFRKSFSKHWQSIDLLDVIHLDLYGPMRTKTHRGMKYFVTFIDDYSRFGYVYFLKHKSDTTMIVGLTSQHLPSKLRWLLYSEA